MNITHRPKGTMCINCKNFNGQPESQCPASDDFKAMKPIGKDKDGTIVVKRNKFERENQWTI